jgi:hypothetical protein
MQDALVNHQELVDKAQRYDRLVRDAHLGWVGTMGVIIIPFTLCEHRGSLDASIDNLILEEGHAPDTRSNGTLLGNSASARVPEDRRP